MTTMDIAYTVLDAALATASRTITTSRKQIQRDPPPGLYHYTNAAGLAGIIGSSKLWATHYRFLNDSSEVNYGLSLFNGLVSAHLKGDQDEVSAEFLSRTLRTANAFDGMFDFYVACFCECDDLLNQWRTYTDQAGGYAIGFEGRQIGHRHQVDNHTQDFFLRKVEYNEAIQRVLIQEVLDLTLAALREMTKGASVSDANNAIARCCHFVRVEIAEYLLCFKHPAFHTEQEWRLCHVTTPNEESHLLFRNGPYGITPYVCLDTSPMAGVNANRLPICAIRHGPTTSADNVRFGLNKLLRRNGYSFVEISGTELPVRVAL